MRRRSALIGGTLGIILGIVPTGADSGASRQNGQSKQPFAPTALTHVTRSNPEEILDFPQAGEKPEGEIGSLPMPTSPTRSSFMATWPAARGAAGYRLDVSTNQRFDNYVNGYRDLDVGDVTNAIVLHLRPATTYYYRVRAYNESATSASSPVMTAATAYTGGLTIDATFDGSITGSPYSATIEAEINRVITIYESLFSDPITVSILFRYSSVGPNGFSPLSGISESSSVIYPINWNDYIDALKADATSSNDARANASLPARPLSSAIKVSSADGRAVGLDTPPGLFANGTVGAGGPFDGIITVNASKPFLFTRPAHAGYFDAQRSLEHEIDEVLGLGSFINNGSDVRPQDLFSWSARGVRNLGATGARYFSITSGSTGIVSFNQNSAGDFGDWLSGPCPQTTPYVQNAFGCSGQVSDISATSPEGINLDVIGYDVASASSGTFRAIVADFNGNGAPDYVLYNPTTRQTAIWYLANNTLVSGAYGPTIEAGWTLVDAADFDGDGHPDYLLVNTATGQTAIWYLNGTTFLRGAFGPTLPAGWRLVAAADFDGDGKPDYLLYNPSTQQTAIWYLNNNVLVSGAFAATLPAGWRLAGVADFDLDGNLDYLLFNPSTQQSLIWYLAGGDFLNSQSGPDIAGGFQLTGTADFDRDGQPDYLLYDAATLQTAIWYLNNNTFSTGAFGPTLPAGWSLTAH